MPSPDLPLDRIVNAVRRWHPGWDSVRAESFVRDEIGYKQEAAALAQEQLAEPEVRRLLEAGATAALAARFVEVGAATNLLYQPKMDQGDLGPLHKPDQQATAVRALVDLLYGEGETVDRLTRYIETTRQAGFKTSWTMPTYFLFLVFPETEMYVKPRVTRAFLRLIGEPFRLRTLNAEDYRSVRDLAHALRDALAEGFGARTMIEAQSVLYVAGMVEQELRKAVGPEDALLVLDRGAAVHEPATGYDAAPADDLPPETRRRVTDALAAFADGAEAWFAEIDFLERNHAFFQDFFRPEHLAALEWPDVQAVGEHLHAMQTMAIAKGNAFGKPNHPPEHYRQSFEYLARGDDPLPIRLHRLRTDDAVRLKYLGESALGEIAGTLFADEFSLFNDRSQWALEYLGVPTPEHGRGFGERFAAFARAVEPVVELYEDEVGQQTGLPVRLEVDQFFSWLYETYRERPTVDTTNPKAESVWLFSPGRNARLWEASYEAGEMTIGWDRLGDLRQYPSAKAIAERLHETSSSASRQTNNALACWEFAHEMRVGDLVLAKRGTDTIVGVGRVAGEYEFDASRETHRHVRRVDWTERDEWDVNEGNGGPLVTKTLTRISKYPDFAARLKTLVGITDGAPVREPRHWWLVASPRIWSMAQMPIGETQSYTSRNESENKRRIFDHFEALAPGDLVVGYESSPVMQAIALLTVTRGLHQDEEGAEQVEFEKTADLPDGPTWHEIRATPELEEAEFQPNSQGSLFALTPEEYATLLDMAGAEVEQKEDVAPAAPQVRPYSVARAAEGAFVSEDEIQGWVDLLRHRKNLILQGPPGVGKTFLARRLAYALMGAEAPDRVRFVQFHQSYAYEDFVQGFRPSEEGRFVLRDGVFYEFASRARDHPDKPHVFVIDEINRGNLSKIFGELMMLIEPEKRSAEHAIPLTYFDPAQTRARFYVPANLHLLGMMNTADRSLAVVDYALRRRFAFVTLAPQLGERFAHSLRQSGADAALVARVTERMGALNAQIAADPDLGTGFCVGHSYVCPREGQTPDAAWFERVVRTEIGPLLREYWFDRPDEAQRAVDRLLA